MVIFTFKIVWGQTTSWFDICRRNLTLKGGFALNIFEINENCVDNDYIFTYLPMYLNSNSHYIVYHEQPSSY